MYIANLPATNNHLKHVSNEKQNITNVVPNAFEIIIWKETLRVRKVRGLEAINILKSVANNFALEFYDVLVTVRCSDYETIGRLWMGHYDLYPDMLLG